MIYHVELSENALKTLKKLDKFTVRIIYEWIEKNLESCEDPRAQGKALVANRCGQWRYKVGDYRIIALILDDKLIIQVINIGHRKTIYIR